MSLLLYLWIPQHQVIQLKKYSRKLVFSGFINKKTLKIVFSLHKRNKFNLTI